MASKDDDRASSSERIIEREMAESVVRARKALNRYVDIRDTLALQNRNPENDHRTAKALKGAHEATLDAFKYLSDYIETEHPDYWNKKVVGYDGGDPVVLGARPTATVEDGEVVDPDVPEGVRFLEDYYGLIRQDIVERHEEFVGTVQSVQYRPALLDFEVYDTTVQLLFRIMKESEFAPQSAEGEIESEPLL